MRKLSMVAALLVVLLVGGSASAWPPEYYYVACDNPGPGWVYYSGDDITEGGSCGTNCIKYYVNAPDCIGATEWRARVMAESIGEDDFGAMFEDSTQTDIMKEQKWLYPYWVQYSLKNLDVDWDEDQMIAYFYIKQGGTWYAAQLYYDTE